MSAVNQGRRRRRVWSSTGGRSFPRVAKGRLDFGKGLGIHDTIGSSMCTFFSHVKLPGQLEVHSRPSQKAADAILLVRKQPVYSSCQCIVVFVGRLGWHHDKRMIYPQLGSKVLMETLIQATHTSLKELRVRVVRSMVRLQGGSPSGSTSLSAATDLGSRHRVMLESTMGFQEDKQTLFATISSDFASRIAWGVACSYKLDPRITVFSRYSSDAFAGRRLILQGVGRVGLSDTVSAMWAAAVGRPAQAALSWTHALPSQGDSFGESVQLKVLYGGSGAFVLSWKAQVGNSI